MKESCEKEDSNNERFMFLFSVVGMSPTLLNSQNKALNSQSVDILTQSGHISNVTCAF